MNATTNNDVGTYTFQGVEFTLTRFADDPAQPWQAQHGAYKGQGTTKDNACRSAALALLNSESR